MTYICIRPAARPSRRSLVYLCAALAGIAAGVVIGLVVRAVPGSIPADARVVTVTPLFGLGNSGIGNPKPGDGFTITDPATVAQIAAVINSLRPMPTTGIYNCPTNVITANTLTDMQLTFRAAPGGPVVASVTAEYIECQFVWGTVGTRSLWLNEYTSSGQQLQPLVLAIAGVHWPYPTG